MKPRSVFANQILETDAPPRPSLLDARRAPGSSPAWWHDADHSSVLRAVTGLAPADETVRVSTDDGWGHYGVAAGRHEHLACSIVEFLAEPVRHSSGFAVSSHQLVLTGTCASHHPRASRSFMRLRLGLWRARTPAAYGSKASGWAAARISFATWAIVSTAWR